MRILSLTLLALLLSSCSAPKQAIDPGVGDSSRPTILIAQIKGSQTAYKQSLIDLIRRDYSGSYNVLVREVKEPSDIASEPYSALIVMESLKAWTHMNRGLKKFAALPDQSRILYFVSSGDPDWRWNKPGVNVVTAATQKAKAEGNYPAFREKLDALLQE